MELLNPIAIGGAIPTTVLPLGTSLALWAPLLAVLAVAAVGIWWALPRPQPGARALRLVHSIASG